MTRQLPPLSWALDEHGTLSPVDPAAKVQPFERWIPLARKSVLVGSNGDPVRPSWVSHGGLIVYQMSRRWQGDGTRIVSARLWSVTRRQSIIARGMVIIEAIVEIDELEYFRLAFVPDEGRPAEGFRRFVRSALAERAERKPPARPFNGRWPVNDAG